MFLLPSDQPLLRLVFLIVLVAGVSSLLSKFPSSSNSASSSSEGSSICEAFTWGDKYFMLFLLTEVSSLTSSLFFIPCADSS